MYDPPAGATAVTHMSLAVHVCVCVCVHVQAERVPSVFLMGRNVKARLSISHCLV